MVAGVQAGQRAGQGDSHAHREHRHKPVRDEARGGAGDDEHRHDQHHTHDLQRHHGGQRQHNEQQRAKQTRTQPHRLRKARVEGVQHEVAALDQQHGGNHHREDSDLPDVRPGHAQHVTEEDMVQVGIRRRNRNQHQTEREHGREHDADRGVLAHAAAAPHPADERHRHERGNDRTHREGCTENVGEHHAGQHRMRDRVAHERPAEQHEPAGQQGADGSGDDGDHECAEHEGQGQRLHQKVEDVHLVLPFRRADRSSAGGCSTGGGSRRAGVHFHAEGTHQVLGSEHLLGGVMHQNLAAQQ